MEISSPLVIIPINPAIIHGSNTMIIGDKFPLLHSVARRGSLKCKLNSRIVRARGDKASFRGNPGKKGSRIGDKGSRTITWTER